MTIAATHSAQSGRFEPVWTVEIQAVPDDVDRLLDAVVAKHPLRYGKYERNNNPSRWWNNGHGLPERISL